MKFKNTEVFNFENALRGMRNPLNSWDKSDSVFYTIYDESADTNFDEWVYEQAQKNGIDIEDYLRYEEFYRQKADQCSKFKFDSDCHEITAIGQDDMKLARRLIEGGPEHRKFLRQIMVSVDITAPLYWWKEFDTYKVGTVANSTSTMHKLASTPITLDCFEIDDYEPDLIIDEGIDTSGDTPFNFSYPLNVFIEDKSNIEHFYFEETLIGFLETLRKKYLETKDKRYWKELVRWLPEGWLQMRTVTLNYENLRTIYHQRQNHKLTEWHDFCHWVENLPYAQEFIIN